VDLYIHSPIRLHGVVLNKFSTGTTLPFIFYRQEERVWYKSLTFSDPVQNASGTQSAVCALSTRRRVEVARSESLPPYRYAALCAGAA
jgi:hypothetical protein